MSESSVAPAPNATNNAGNAQQTSVDALVKIDIQLAAVLTRCLVAASIIICLSLTSASCANRRAIRCRARCF